MSKIDSFILLFVNRESILLFFSINIAAKEFNVSSKTCYLV